MDIGAWWATVHGLLKSWTQLSDYCTQTWSDFWLKKDHCEGEKTAFRLGENNSKRSNRQRINLKNIQATPAAQFQKNKRPNQKVGQRTKQTFKKTYRWLTNTWKDAQHHSLLERCKSKPQWGTISCQSGWLLSKSLQAINAGEGVEKREPSYTVGGNAN